MIIAIFLPFLHICCNSNAEIFLSLFFFCESDSEDEDTVSDLVEDKDDDDRKEDFIEPYTVEQGKGVWQL